MNPSRNHCLGLIACSLLMPQALAQISVYESEPNDSPGVANPISGAVTLIGSMPGNDQDGYLWTVSDNDARKRWTFELQGIPGALTVTEIVRIEFADDGVEVQKANRMLKISSRDGLTAAVVPDLIFEPGEYLIGIAHAGGPGRDNAPFRPPAGGLSFGQSGTPENTIDTAPPPADDPAAGTSAYRLIIREGKPLAVTAKAGAHASREQAMPMRTGREFAAFETQQTTWYAFPFSAKDVAQRWDIVVQVPVGRNVDAVLYDSAGEKLASTSAGPNGHLKFPDLAPEVQTYLVEVNSKEQDFIRAIGSGAVGQRVSGEEAEPNGEWKLANRVDLSTPLAGRVSEKTESDYFQFAIDEAASNQMLNLTIESTVPNQALEFCLLGTDGSRVQCRRANTPVTLPKLALTPGDWGLSVSRAEAGLEYRISLSAAGPITPGAEVEPNDSIAFASGVPTNNRIKGRIDGEEQDFYRFTVASEPQLWRFQVIGENLFEVEYQDLTGRRASKVRPVRGQTRVQLENLYLMPGQHFLRVSGSKDADYTVLARALGAPDPNGEREPNDDDFRMQPLGVGQTRTGLLSELQDQDRYRFFLAHRDHVRLTVQPPADGTIEPQIYWYGDQLAIGAKGKPGEPMTLAGVFPPGDYHVVLAPKKASDAEYRLSLERLPRFSCAADCEPSDLSNLYQVSPLPADGVLEGRSGEWRDTDSYALPLLTQPTELFIRSAEPVRVSLGLHRLNTKAMTYDKASGGFRTTVPAGGPYQLLVESGDAPYRLELEFVNGPTLQSPAPLPADMQLAFDAPAVSAYRMHGQQVAGRLEIQNRGNAPLALNLEAVTSDYRWQVALDNDKASVAPGGRASIAVEVNVPPDAWAERPVRISARAYGEHGSQVEAWQEIDVDRDIAAVNPSPGWTIPEELRGGFNAAWLPFGGRWTETLPKGSRYDFARDGLVFAGINVECCSPVYEWEPDFRPELTLQLPGDQVLPVAGIALNHFGSTSVLRNIRQAVLLLSVDGITFEEALAFEALPVETEQYFALPEPVMARFARLRILSTFNLRPGGGGVSLGEWKVITRPGHDLSGGNGYNIADPALGGHLVSDWPPQFYSPGTVVDLDNKGHFVSLKVGEVQDYVIGFNHNRTAKIHRIEWDYASDVKPAEKFDRATVSISTDSSIGPWTPVGELTLADAGTAAFDIEPAIWARFVKITATPDKTPGKFAAPATIRIQEQPTGAEYRSVLTEWGHASRQAFFEEQQGLQPEPPFEAADNDTRQRAAALAVGQLAAGQVALARQEHWYRMQVPAGQNVLTVAVTGEDTVRAAVALETASGEPIPLSKNTRDSVPKLHLFEAQVDPGAEVYFHVAEPPRNVVFTWDTSASVNAFLPTIYNSLSAFASEVVPGQEAVNLVPFSHPPLLRDWYGEPYVLQTILNDYGHTTSSSSAEKSLDDATWLLAPLAGSKAVVVITDGITVHHGPMWKAMREVQPRVFGIGVGGTEAWNVDVFEDWASVNGGHYQHLVYTGEMEVAFDRAATLMRRPADYTLLVSAEYREAPGPGTLTVSRGDKSAAGGGTVELILDASGSMLQRLEGTRRIAIAKAVLTEAVTKHIPAGTPMALRVFGHREPDACRSDLEIPLSPLNPAAAARVIAGIQAMNLARTPIADSLAAVAGDLKKPQGRVAIVLVTDGEETCEGDPAKVIESLQAQGMDVNLNIVGFAIDNPALEAQFAGWAEQGNGRYFSASNQVGLSESIREALQTPYSVFDGSGSLVAEGLVDGDPLELPQGTYRVVVHDAQSTAIEDVQVISGENNALTLGGPRDS